MSKRWNVEFGGLTVLALLMLPIAERTRLRDGDAILFAVFALALLLDLRITRARTRAGASAPVVDYEHMYNHALGLAKDAGFNSVNDAIRAAKK